MAADGSIIIDTRVNTKGAEADLKALQAKAKSTTQQISALDKQITQATGKRTKLADDLAKAKTEAQATETALQGVNSQLEAAKSAAAAQVRQEYHGMSDANVNSIATSRVLGSNASLVAESDKLTAALDKQTATVAEIEAEYQKQVNTVSRLQQQHSSLQQQLQQEQAVVSKQTTQYVAKQKAQKRTAAQNVSLASTAMQKFGTRLSGIVSGALLFNVISSALTKMVGWFGSAMQSSDAFRQSLANLQGAASVAAAPLVQALGNALAYINNLLATGISYLARFISLLTGKSIGAMKSAAKGMNSYGSAASGAAKDTEKATRSLAGFDEITRLDAPQDNTSDSGAGSTAPNYDFVDAAGTGLSSMAETIGKFLEPLKQIDLTPLKTALQGLLEAAKPLTQTLFAGLEWAWYNLFVPMAQWTVESALPAFLDVLAAGCRVLNAALQALAPLGQWLWDSFLHPIASWTGGMIVSVLEGVADALQNVADWISRNQTLVQNIAVVLGSFAAAWGIVTTAVTLWNTVSALATAATTALGAAVAFLTSPVGIAIAVIGSLIAAGVLLYQNWDVVKAKLSAAWESIRQAASSAWNAVGTTIQDVWNGITGTIKGAVNSILGFINRMISGLCSGLNSMIGMLNKLKIDVPDGVPIIGGTKFGFDIDTITAPQIPYLAQGAVIPPNREFMAVLGDQSHGTNVEAPLATIQEAVAAVMQDYQDGNLAALGQVLATLREILSAIYGINIGDEVIGQAAARYQTRQSIITGRA